MKKATIEIESVVTGRRIMRDIDITGLHLSAAFLKIVDHIARTHNAKLISIIFSEDTVESVVEGGE